MPVYDMKCGECLTVIEDVILSISKRNKRINCPKCGKKMERLLGTFRTVSIANHDNETRILFSTGRSKEH